MDRLTEAPEPDPIAAEAVRLLLPGRTHNVSSLPKALYISKSQLRRRLQEATGFAPKVLHRMLRFQGFLALAQRYDTAAASWRDCRRGRCCATPSATAGRPTITRRHMCRYCPRAAWRADDGSVRDVFRGD